MSCPTLLFQELLRKSHFNFQNIVFVFIVAYWSLSNQFKKLHIAWLVHDFLLWGFLLFFVLINTPVPSFSAHSQGIMAPRPFRSTHGCQALDNMCIEELWFVCV